MFRPASMSPCSHFLPRVSLSWGQSHSFSFLNKYLMSSQNIIRLEKSWKIMDIVPVMYYYANDNLKSQCHKMIVIYYFL